MAGQVDFNPPWWTEMQATKAFAMPNALGVGFGAFLITTLTRASKPGTIF